MTSQPTVLGRLFAVVALWAVLALLPAAGARALTVEGFEHIASASGTARTTFDEAPHGLKWTAWAIEPYGLLKAFGNDSFNPGEGNSFTLSNARGGRATEPAVAVNDGGTPFFLVSVDVNGFLEKGGPNPGITAPSLNIVGRRDGVEVGSATVDFIDAGTGEARNPTGLITAELARDYGWDTPVDEVLFRPGSGVARPLFVMDNFTFEIESVVVPAPGALLLLASGLTGLLAAGRRRPQGSWPAAIMRS